MKTPCPFIVAFALIFYVNGAAFIESFVNYPSWRLIGADNFVRYHQSIGPPVIALLVVPALLGSVFTIALLRYRPAAIPLWSVWVAVAFQITIWISTVTIQIPIQIEFSTLGFSEERLSSLIRSNLVLRRIPSALTAALFVWMMHRVLTAAGKSVARGPD